MSLCYLYFFLLVLTGESLAVALVFLYLLCSNVHTHNKPKDSAMKHSSINIDELNIEHDQTTAHDLREYLDALEEQGFNLKHLPIMTPTIKGEVSPNDPRSWCNPVYESIMRMSLYREEMSDSSVCYSLKSEVIEIGNDEPSIITWRNSEGNYERETE